MMGVLIHVIGDCANNLGVIIAAAVIWFANYGGRFYADPAVSMGIAIMIFISSIPLSTFSPITSPAQSTSLTYKQSNTPASSCSKVPRKVSTTTTSSTTCRKSRAS
jgi:Co/Zn/Cd efflux system component